MPYLRLKHLFYFLMMLSGAAFLAPARWIEGRLPSPTAIFSPISWPSGKVAHWAHDLIAAPDLSSDDRKADVVRRENEALRNEVSALQTRVAMLEEREAAREKVGDIRQWCTPFAVIGNDSGARASLGIQGASWKGLRDGMVALYASGIVGRVEGVGISGARVQLITDIGFRLRVSFARFNGNTYTRLAEPSQTVAEGTGRGAMIIVGLSREAVAKSGLQVRDLVILNEPDWPSYLQGRSLGHITSIGTLPDAPQMSKIVVEPDQNLLRLNEVLIITHPPETQTPPQRSSPSE